MSYMNIYIRVFFVKQKTAYELRISDWSSDVCSSDLRYLAIIRAKTAALFAAASQISAVVAECSEEQERALEDYGRNLGVAFQLVDDAIDYDSEDRKSVGEGKSGVGRVDLGGRRMM